MKNFTIEASEKNINWVLNNLDIEDYAVVENQIIIHYYNKFQKTDILNALP